MERLSPVDVAWVRMDAPTNPMVVTAVLWFDGPLDRERLRDLVGTRMLGRFPRFGERVLRRGGRLFWEADPAFDLDRRLVFGHLPDPGGQAELEAFVSEALSTPLSLDEPPWRMFALEGYGSGWALVARLHHGLGDGFALASVLLSLADAANPDAPPVHHALDRPHGPLAATHTASRGLGALGKLVFASPDRRTALRGQLGPRKLAAWSPSWPLDAVKQAARAHGVTVNDLLMAALAGALRRWMEAHGGRPRKVRAFVPVDLRPPDQPIPPSLGNAFGLVYLALPADEPTPEARLATTRARMEAIKHTPEAALAHAILALIGWVPALVQRVAIALFAMKGSLVATNVPGPTERLVLAGSPLGGLRFWAPEAADVSTGVSILSYAGSIGIGVASDAEIVPDPRALVDGFAAELVSFGIREGPVPAAGGRDRPVRGSTTTAVRP